MSAAIVVVLHHVFVPPYFQGSIAFPGRSAVIIFFVISGFVITYSTDGQRHWQRYAVARLARIYSVAVPAILLSLVLVLSQSALTGRALPPNSEQPALRVLISLLFANQFWNLTVAALSNGPYWSLCYEVWYYVLFGIATFASPRWRLAGVLGVCLMVGPRILLLLPIWLMGVGTYAAMKRWPPTTGPFERAVFVLALVLTVGCMTLGSPADAIGGWVKQQLVDGYWTWGGMRIFLGGDHGFASDWLLGALFSVAVYTSRSLGGAGRPMPARQIVERSSSYTFSLYLFHAPILQFAHAVLAGQLPVAAVPWVMLVLIAGCTWALGSCTEHRKEPWSRLFGRMFVARRQTVA